MKSRVIHRWRTWCIGVPILYICFYACLSLLGGYRMLPSGNLRPYGLAIVDSWIWEPLGGSRYQFRTAGGILEHRSDIVGSVFAPLIELDQKHVHRILPIIPDDIAERTNRYWPRSADLHPFAERIEVATAEIAEKYGLDLMQARLAKDSNRLAALQKEMFSEYDSRIGNETR
jgi:hypothetical protein